MKTGAWRRKNVGNAFGRFVRFSWTRTTTRGHAPRLLRSLLDFLHPRSMNVLQASVVSVA